MSLLSKIFLIAAIFVGIIAFIVVGAVYASDRNYNLRADAEALERHRLEQVQVMQASYLETIKDVNVRRLRHEHQKTMVALAGAARLEGEVDTVTEAIQQIRESVQMFPNEVRFDEITSSYEEMLQGDDTGLIQQVSDLSDRIDQLQQSRNQTLRYLWAAQASEGRMQEHIVNLESVLHNARQERQGALQTIALYERLQPDLGSNIGGATGYRGTIEGVYSGGRVSFDLGNDVVSPGMILRVTRDNGNTYVCQIRVLAADETGSTAEIIASTAAMSPAMGDTVSPATNPASSQ